MPCDFVILGQIEVDVCESAKRLLTWAHELLSEVSLLVVSYWL